MKAIVTIVKNNREKIIVPNAKVTFERFEAQMITDAAIAVENVQTADIKIAEYTIDGNMVFAYIRNEHGELDIAYPQKATK